MSDPRNENEIEAEVAIDENVDEGICDNCGENEAIAAFGSPPRRLCQDCKDAETASSQPSAVDPSGEDPGNTAKVTASDLGSTPTTGNVREPVTDDFKNREPRKKSGQGAKDVINDPDDPNPESNPNTPEGKNPS